jgi:cytochrome c oxidase cbb3-type subunit I/II
MGGVELIYSPTPDWYETLTIAFAIGALVPVLVIVTDLGLILKGNITHITDRASLRYGVVSGLALVGATIVNLLLAWRATSGVVQYSTWTSGLDVILVLGGASFAIFAVNSIRRGGSSTATGMHFTLSVIGVAGTAVGLLAGGIVTGFSWIAGPSSQIFDNFGAGYEIAVASLKPFLWLAAVSLVVYAVAQVVYIARIGTTSPEELATPSGHLDYNLEFEGSVRYVTWKRLAWGAAFVWLTAALFTAVLPAMDDTDTAATIAADRSRTYESGTPQAAGRSLYISEGCTECHTQSVRPIITDVGLGPVSIAGDFAHENPALVSGTRIGPDLTHVASRGDSFDATETGAHLKNPRSDVEWSTMPSYSYLSDADIEALVRYIETLR